MRIHKKQDGNASGQPSWFISIAVMVYESLLLIALLGSATFVFILIAGDSTQGLKRHLLQLSLWLIAGLYFVTSWMKVGQTLAMKTWKVKVKSVDGHLLSLNRAVCRYCLASLSLVLFGAGFFWAIFDRDGVYLHDRLVGSHLTRLNQE
jgi:uncharacterized RDD family membrane protein YckC